MNQPFDARLRQALRELPHGQPPLDFAHGVAARAEGRAAGSERWWMLVPALAFVPAAIYAVARYGEGWAAAFAPVLAIADAATVANWALATSGCLAVTWVLGKLRPAVV